MPAFVPQPMSSDETAGLVPQRFWNNGFGSFGTADLEIDAGSSMSVHVSGFSVTWNAPSTHVTDTGGLMGTFISGSDEPGSEATVQVQGIPENFVAPGYAVIVYFGGGLRSTFSSPRVTQASVAAANYGSRSIYGLTRDPSAFGWTRIPASSSTDEGLATPTGNVMVFAGLHDPSFTLTVSGGTASDNLRLGVLNGFQIVPVSALPGDPPTISTGASLTATGTVSAPFSYSISAQGATSYAAIGLPDGLSVDPATGAITGSPVLAGSFTVTLQAVNSFGSASATLALTINPAVSNADYQVLDLGTLSGETTPSDLNDLGQVVGYSKDPAGNLRAFLFDGAFTELAAGGAISSAAAAINNHGQIIGTYRESSGKSIAARFTGATAEPLFSTPFNSYGVDLTPAGDVVGFTDENGGTPFFLRNGTLLTLGESSGFSLAEAYGVNDRGAVVGLQRVAPGAYPYHAALWSAPTGEPSSVPTDIGLPGLFSAATTPFDAANNSLALDINSTGQVVGYAALSHNYYHAFLHENGQMLDLATLPGYVSSQALAINDAEEVVGSSNPTISSGNGSDRAIIWTRSGGMRDLNDLIPPDSGWVLSQAVAINNRGQIAGFGSSGGQKRAFLLSPRQLRLALIDAPRSQTVVRGIQTTLSVVVAGTGSISYQWKLNGSAIDGATNAVLEILSTRLTDAGSYSVEITDATGTLLTPAAELTVLTPPQIDLPPLAQTVLAGAAVSFAVQASGTAPLFFQWRHNESPIAGATNDVLALENVQLADAGLYDVGVTNSLGVATSTPVLLQVLIQPKTSIALYAGITIEGQTGQTYQIEYSEALTPASPWKALGSVTLTNQVQLYFDLESARFPERFYRAILQR